MNEYVSPIVRSQGRQQKSFVFKLANFQKSLTRNLTMKNQRMSSDNNSPSFSDDDGKDVHKAQDAVHQEMHKSNRKYMVPLLLDDSEAYTTDDEEVNAFQGISQSKRHQIKYSDVEDSIKINTVIKSKKNRLRISSETQNMPLIEDGNYNRSSQSLPDLVRTKSRPDVFSTESEAALTASRNSSDLMFSKRSSSASFHKVRPYQELLKILQVNYSKKETNFIMSLQNVSLRLSLVPKVARLSALRAELSIINENLLPSEIDIPQLLPITSNKNKSFTRF